MKKRYYPENSIFYLTDWSPISVILTGIFLCLGVQLFFPLIYGFVVDAILGLDLIGAIKSQTFVGESQIFATKVMIILTQTIAFGGTAFFFSKLAKEPEMLGITRVHKFELIILAIIITFSALPLIQFTTIDKDSIHLPESLKSIEDFFLKSEKNTSNYLGQLLKNNFAFNIFFIAVIPGIMEEIFFRGFLQNNLRKILNVHIAILLTGFIFSALHLQIFGFFPRMLLGVLFGYFYYWSGSNLPNIFAHFFNNALSAYFVYYNQSQGKPINISEDSYKLPEYAVIISLIIVSSLLYYYYRVSISSPKSD